MVETAVKRGVVMRPWNFAAAATEAALFSRNYNATFGAHWGAPQFTVEDCAGLITGLRELHAEDLTAFADFDGETVGAVLALPDLNQALHRLKTAANPNSAEVGNAFAAIDHGRRWTRLSVARTDRPGVPMNLPLGTGFKSDYGRERQRMTVGDRLVVVTDGVLEAPSPTGDDFGAEGVERVLTDTTLQSPESVVRALLDALAGHTGRVNSRARRCDDLRWRDCPRPQGPRAVWHVLKNRLLTRVIPSLR